MTIISIPSACAAIVSMSIGLGSTAGASMVYTNQATFLANVQPGAYLESFDSLALGPLNSPMTFSQGSFAYSASVANGFFNVGTSSDVWLSTNFPEDPIVINFSAGNINAVGGFFFGTDFAGNANTGTVTVALDNGSIYSFTDASATNFIGFTFDQPIRSLTVGTTDLSTWATVNDFIVGTAAVPEPPSLVMLCLGVGVVLATRQLGPRLDWPVR